MERLRIGDYQVEQEPTADRSVELYRGVHTVLPRRAMIRLARAPHDSVAVLREACLLAALPHPGIVRVFETGRLEQRTWFAHEIVEGLTLQAMFQALPATTVGTASEGSEPSDGIEAATAVGMLRDVAEILAYAHQRGVIHCAISPEKLVVSRGRGFAMCVTEWAAARAHDASTPFTGELGPFTAPELLQGDIVDDRVDVFALGVVAYRTLTGRMPAVHPIPTEVHCPGVPRELTALVDQMLSQDRWDRPSAAEVRAELAWLATALATQTGSVEVVRMRRPRWTPQIDSGKTLRAQPEPEPGNEPRLHRDDRD
jgi:serine/threonine protein kinase